MNSQHSRSEQVWNATLPHLRATRRRRKIRKLAATASCVILAAAWLALRPAPPSAAAPVVVSASPPAVETLAVYRVGDNGTVWLEEVATTDLGATELTFGLTPVVLNDRPQDW